MVVKRGGLGRNLSALLNTNSTLLSSSNLDNAPNNQTLVYLTLDVNRLQPGKYQPRRNIAESNIVELADSIKQQGLLQPLVVRKTIDSQYEIIAGERRWRACLMAGITEVPVIVRQVNDETAMAMALIENLQREDLNAIDKATAMQRLVSEFDLTHQQIADILCQSRAAVSNYLRLLNLNADVRHLLTQGDLDMGHARCLLMLDETLQTKTAEVIVAKQLSVRETEALVARVKAGTPIHEQKPDLTPQFKEQLQLLASQLQTKIKLRQGSKGRGTLVIHYDDTHNLETMIGRLIGERDKNVTKNWFCSRRNCL